MASTTNGLTTTPHRPQPASTKSYTTTPVSRKSTATIETQEQESPLVVCYDGSTTNDGTSSRSGMKSSSTNSALVTENILSFTIVWSPLPPITWLIPFIGHTGICNSSGIASDFRGPYYVGDDGRMAFGPPTRYYKININQCNVTPEQWDTAIQMANELYSGRMHNIFCDNCHSHVAYALNQMPVSACGIHKWNMVKIAVLMFFRGSFLSWSTVLQQFLPFSIIITLIVVFNKVL
jgi:transmembrane protein 222